MLEVIASTDDTDYVHDNSNTTHTGTASFALANMPADFGTMLTLNINLRYAWGAGTQVNTWDNLRARVFKSDGTTALTNSVTIASAITTTTATDSGATAFTGVDTTATKADWDAAVVHIFFDITRNKGGDSLTERVFAAEITGTYNIATASGTGWRQSLGGWW